MRILIINPNSSKNMTSIIQEAADNYSGGEFEVKCLSNPEAPDFIESYEDQVKSAPGMIKIVKNNENKYDAFIIACHCDPNLDTLKEITARPVIGIGEASMKIASMLGHRFSVISASLDSIPNKEALIRKYHLQDLLASIKVAQPDEDGKVDNDKFLSAAADAINEDMAEVIVLGCACMSGLDKYIQDKLGIPVLDGVICALIIATGLVKYQVSTSKIRKYKAK